PLCTPTQPLSDNLISTVTSPTRLSSLSLHDALPISRVSPVSLFATLVIVRPCETVETDSLSVSDAGAFRPSGATYSPLTVAVNTDRKSTRLNSSHVKISYAVFCLKKKKKIAAT